MDELKEMSAKINEDNPGVAGFVARTGRTAAVTQFSSFLFSYGGDFDDGVRAWRPWIPRPPMMPTTCTGL